MIFPPNKVTIMPLSHTWLHVCMQPCLVLCCSIRDLYFFYVLFCFLFFVLVCLVGFWGDFVFFFCLFVFSFAVFLSHTFPSECYNTYIVRERDSICNYSIFHYVTGSIHCFTFFWQHVLKSIIKSADVFNSS